MKGILSLYILLAISTVSLMGCKEKTNNKLSQESSLNDNSPNLRDSLLGLWGGRGESMPGWSIGKDSIYYFERSVAYPYKIIDRDFVIYFPDHTGSLRSIRVDYDTMFFLDEQGLTVKAYRFKK